MQVNQTIYNVLKKGKDFERYMLMCNYRLRVIASTVRF